MGDDSINMEVVCCFCGQSLPLKDAGILDIRLGYQCEEIQQLFCHKKHLVERLDKSIPLHPDFLEENENVFNAD